MYKEYPPHTVLTMALTEGWDVRSGLCVQVGLNQGRGRWTRNSNQQVALGVGE